jgi:hypothetical protein
MALSALIAGSLALLPMQAPAVLAAIQAQGPHRLEAEYELVLPAPVLGRSRAATASMIADFGPASYAIRATARAEGLIDWLVNDSLDVQSNGSITEGGLVPRRYVSLNTDGSADRRVRVDFLPSEVRIQAAPPFGDLGHPAATLAQRLEAMDPLTALARLALGVGATAENPCGPALRIFDGKQRYDLRLTFSGRVQVRSRAFTGSAIDCAVEYVEIAGFREKTDERRALERANVEWSNILLAEMPGGLTPVLKIEARTRQRGKLTLQATRLAYGPAPATTTVGR